MYAQGPEEFVELIHTSGCYPEICNKIWPANISEDRIVSLIHYAHFTKNAFLIAIKLCSCLIVAGTVSVVTVSAFSHETSTSLPVKQSAASAPKSTADTAPSLPSEPTKQTTTPVAAPPNTPSQPPQTNQAPVQMQKGSPILIYMPDGQLKSHTIAVYVTHNIQEDHDPQLLLLRSHSVTEKEANEDVMLSPILVAPNQEWTQTEDNKQIRRTGTLLLFDLSSAHIFPKAMIRVRPIVYWTEGGVLQKAVGKSEVNVGDIVAACVWTLLFAIAALSLVIVLARRAKKTAGGAKGPVTKAVQFLTAVDGHLSLGQTQIACWTIVVGSVVLGYGLIRLDIPTIPASLLALMGASLATGGVAYFQDSQKQQAQGDATLNRVEVVPAEGAGMLPASGEKDKNQNRPQLSDLVKNFTADQTQGQLSLAKAQMIFWTVLLLVLFVSKSILDGAIWDIPWALVALMGFSQIGYLAPKIAPSS